MCSIKSNSLLSITARCVNISSFEIMFASSSSLRAKCNLANTINMNAKRDLVAIV